MAKKCAICGGKVSMGYTCFTGGLSFHYDPNRVPLINNIDRSEGWFCDSCAAAIGQTKGTLKVTDYNSGYPLATACLDVPGQRQQGLDHLNRHINNIRNENIKNTIASLMRESTSVLENVKIYNETLPKLADRMFVAWSYFDRQYPEAKTGTSENVEFRRTDNCFFFSQYGKEFIDQLVRLGFNQFLADLVNELYLKEDCLDLKKIKIGDIEFFQEKGEIQYTTSVGGGGGYGGGVNMKGAIAGGLLFGGFGAIVGSQVGTNTIISQVKSTTKKHDDRYIILRYRNEQGMFEENKFGYACYDIFMKLIPEKEYTYIIAKGNITTTQQTKSDGSQDVVTKLKQFKGLLDAGIITQEEFEAKKKQLLAL